MPFVEQRTLLENRMQEYRCAVDVRVLVCEVYRDLYVNGVTAVVNIP